ncbi:MAG: Rrf2 family transcriptional regulator [Candidatus Omnitrophota bacterium]|jgi:Rrf2 family iron-sulfur cluster assembly transcriptional regulator|nr:MAG: Rrf2 family transcriptional regulator [Candidatus Omnitrophota bacterium]
MKLSAKVEYAYKAVLELAIRYGDKSPIQLATISEAQGIPKKFLTQLFIRLKNANLVTSERGVAGGYYLTKPPSQIALADVITAIDDSIMASSSRKKLNKMRESEKIIFRIWRDINDQIATNFKHITFDQIAAQVRNEQLTYYI